MRRVLAIIAFAVAAAGSAAAEDGKDFSTFIGDGIYSPPPGCKTLEAIESGSQEPNISNYPLTLSNEGSRSWEGGCDVMAGSETKPGQFEAKLKCFEGDQEYDDKSTFRRIDDTHIEIATDKDKLVYEKCTNLKNRDADD